jgi:hypothetical protein
LLNRTDPYAALVDRDDWATEHWLRTCSWSVEAKREALIEMREDGLRAAMQSAQSKQIEQLTRRIANLEKSQAQCKRLMVDVVARALANFGKDEGYLNHQPP